MIFKKNYPNDIFWIISSISNILSIQTREKSKLETQSSFDGQIDAILTSACFFLFFCPNPCKLNLIQNKLSYEPSRLCSGTIAPLDSRVWITHDGAVASVPLSQTRQPSLIFSPTWLFWVFDDLAVKYYFDAFDHLFSVKSAITNSHAWF